MTRTDKQIAQDLLGALKDARDWLAIQSSSTDSFCEMCEHHAPKDDAGLVTGPIVHAIDCPLGRADAAIARAAEEL